MNCAQILNKLDDYVDGRLDDPARKEVERHVHQCLDCAKALEELRALQRAVAELPREITPSRDLFPEIRASLGASSRSRWTLWAGIAAGFVLLALALRIGLLPPADLQPNSRSESRAQPALRIDASAGEELAAAERQFLEASAELLDALERRRADLSPETRAVLDENLAIVDRAIAEVRAALETDPANLGNERSLQALYRQKLHFLWTASRVSS